MKKLIALSAAVLALVGCDTDSQAKILQAEGFTNVVFTGPSIFGCSEDDSIFTSKGFTATKNGVEFSGDVCCGILFKSCTVRYQ